MKERYLFRGRRLDNGEWAQGYYAPRVYIFGREEPYRNVIVKLVGDTELSGIPFEVDPDTVCQCVGVRDKHGTLIFEGHILRSENGHVGTVVWRGAGFDCDDGDTCYEIYGDRQEVVGNIHDNPELMTQEEEA